MIPAVIVDAGGINALDPIRILESRGVPVIGVFRERAAGDFYWPAVRASRYLQSTVIASDGLVASLLRLGPQLPRGAVLIPAGDSEMLAISKAREALAPFYRFRMPPPEMIETLLDKSRFARLAAQQGIPIPKTLPFSDESSLEASAGLLRFPCVIKPPWRDKAWYRTYPVTKVLLARNQLELLAGGREVLRICGHGLAQERVPGPESNILCTFAFLDEQSEPVCLSACRKIRQYPPYFGNTALAESIAHPEIERITGDICRRLRLVGYVSIEYKHDPDTGQWLVLEITPGRVNRQAGITEIARRSVVAAWYSDLAGTAPDPVRSFRSGVRWASPPNEFRSLPLYLRNKDWSLRAWLRSYWRVRRFELFSLRDPLPWLVALGSIVRFVPRLLRDLSRRDESCPE